jgi:hypothetical protein
MIFSNVFLPILHNIGLYIYTIRYKPGIKIPDFLQNIFKKKFKTFELISFFKKQKKKNSCIRPNPKMLSKHIFFKRQKIKIKKIS